MKASSLLSEPVQANTSLNTVETVLKGTRISPGLASGTVWVSGDILDCGAEAYHIEPDQVETEMERIRRAFEEVEAELEEAARRLSEQIDPSLAEIFRAHELMLENLLPSNEFETELRGSLSSAPEAVKKVFRNGKRNSLQLKMSAGLQRQVQQASYHTRRPNDSRRSESYRARRHRYGYRERG